MKAAVLALFILLGTSNAFSQGVNVCDGFFTATTRAYPNGSIQLCWEFDAAKESAIDGFWLFRAARTGKNLDGMLGAFTKVATIPKTDRQFVLSGSQGTYTYFLSSFKVSTQGTTHSTASNQISVVYTP